jgi:hypothetical protein
LTDPRPTPGRRGRYVLAAVGVAVLVLALVLYASRKVIAREALTGWLRSHGVAATAEVGDFGLGGFKGRVSVGDPRAPDFVAGDADVTYGLRGLTFEIRSVRLTRPVVRARLHGGQLSLGALDPLIAELRKRPPRPDATKPNIAIDNGTLLLATDYGPVRLVADMAMADGKLTALTATSAPARLKGPAFDASLGPGALALRTRGDRVDFNADVAVSKAVAGSLSAEGARLRLTGQAPYPDLIKRRGDGAVTLRASLSGSRLAMAGQRLDGAQLSAAFDGVSAGWIDSLTLTGKAQADLRAASATAGPGHIGAIRAKMEAPDLRWSRKGGDTVSATARLTAALQDVTAGELRVPNAITALAGPVAFGAHGAAVALKGSVGGRGAWTGLGAPTAGDSTEIAAVKRAARAFSFQAPAISLAVSDSATRFALDQPLRVRPAAGGEAVLANRGAGAWRLTVAGGGLPKVEADVSRVAVSDGGATATGRIKAALSIGPVQDGVFDAAGTLRIANGAMSFAGGRCATVKAGRLEFGVNDVLNLSGQLCPARAPLLSLGGGDWRIAGRVQGASAEIPFLQAALKGAAGAVDFAQKHGRLSATAAITSAEVYDTSPAMRFRPLLASGPARLAGDVWTADLAFRTPAGQAIGRAKLVHDTRTGVGGVAIETGTLTFADGGLQPIQLSPLASVVGTPAEGQAIFSGRFDWTPTGAASSGALDIPRLDFLSPAGRVTGLSGRIVFTSLAPLIAAPGQVLRAEGVDAFAAFTGASATFEVQEKALVISGGEATVGGGKVRVQSLTVPLVAGAPMRGSLLVEGVQLHDLVEASPFGDKVDLDAKVSGRMPFESQDGKVRILGGDLHAIQPGRLSIDRSAVEAVTAGGTVEAPAVAATAVDPNETFTDFAYQAMENLAFTTLDAGVATREDGRLGVLFHIVGKHDPPQRQEIKLSLFDLIGRKFLGRKLPLPSDTAVDLTLDTTLNLDDLLKDYGDYQRLRSSAPVQTPEPR